jgi:hypothetical protein
MLKGIKTKISEFRNFLPWCPNTKNSALILRTFFSRKKVVI